MSILWFVAGVIVAWFLPSPVGAWGRGIIKKIWNKIFKKKEEDIAV